ncbi:hypothetical protein C8R43DRAFT_1135539 [Mycena crocata]|nr:hypothetical protein C8R43DRAFT_1135539 [Mycena crocata]
MATLVLPRLQPRHRAIAAIALLQAIFCLALLKLRFWDSDSLAHTCDPDSLANELHLPATEEWDDYNRSAVSRVTPADAGKVDLEKQAMLNGAPTAAFRDNLRSDVQYITTWPANGWSNQQIEYVRRSMNMLYLALMTERIPILPRFRPVHLDEYNVSHLDFGDIFDVPRLERHLGKQVLEWRQVKDLESEKLDDVGCWDIQQNKVWGMDDVYLEPPVDLKLDISYTVAPEWFRLASETGNPATFLWSLASLVTFNKRAATLPSMPAPVISPAHQLALRPDDQLFCCNSIYVGIDMLEDAGDVNPAWHAVGQHMHWTTRIQDIADSYKRQTLGVPAEEPIPPYIAVHVRHGDFSIWCNIDNVPTEVCFAPLMAVARRVDEVRAKLVQKLGVVVDHVIITSDEEDPEWWKPVYERGWRRPDHAKTVENFGPWYPMIIDEVIHGDGLGFVGTATSTVSILGRRRVASRGGITEMVKWGRPFADEHR